MKLELKETVKMERRKTQQNFKPDELYVKLSPQTLCSCLILVTSGTIAFDYVSFVHDVGREVCPFTNFCHTNASMILENDEVPCCVPCSCSDHCAEMNGDCCPDTTVTIKQAPKAKCKAAVVKQEFGDDRRFDGYTHDVPRYRVIDTCPENENNFTFVSKCEGNKTTVDQFLWVSDKIGRVYENRFCAFCNGLSSGDIFVWGIRTTCSSVLTASYSSLSTTLLSDQCDIKLELPKKERHVLHIARCFISNIFRCNQTGHWDRYNSSIETACETFDAPVLYFPQDERFALGGMAVKIYKNIYCVACNEWAPRSFNPLCSHLELGDGRHQFKTLSILIDFEDATSTATRLQSVEGETGHCDLDEVYDSYKERCLKLFCPFGSMAYQERCRNIALDTQKLAILIQYRLMMEDLSDGSKVALDHVEKEALGQAIFNSFKLKSGAKKYQCFSCADKIYIHGDNMTELYLSIKIYTSFVCNLDTIFELGTGVVGKTLKVKHAKEQSFNLYVVEMEKRPLGTLTGFKYLYSSFKPWCSAHYTLNKQTICPEVSIDYSEITAIQKQASLRVTDSGLSDKVHVCWADYMLAMSKINKSASPRQCHLTVIGLTVFTSFLM